MVVVKLASRLTVWKVLWPVEKNADAPPQPPPPAPPARFAPSVGPAPPTPTPAMPPPERLPLPPRVAWPFPPAVAALFTLRIIFSLVFFLFENIFSPWLSASVRACACCGPLWSRDTPDAYGAGGQARLQFLFPFPSEKEFYFIIIGL